MFNKNTIIIVLAIVCLAVIIGGGILVFGNVHEAYNGTTINNTNNTSVSVDNVTSQSSSSGLQMMVIKDLQELMVVKNT